MTRLCRDCRWIEWPPWALGTPRRAYDAMCLHESSVMPRPADLVLGLPVPARRMSCAEARAWDQGCGPEGKHWEAA